MCFHICSTKNTYSIDYKTHIGLDNIEHLTHNRHRSRKSPCDPYVEAESAVLSSSDSERRILRIGCRQGRALDLRTGWQSTTNSTCSIKRDARSTQLKNDANSSQLDGILKLSQPKKFHTVTNTRNQPNSLSKTFSK
jgi:hypothetical protein